MTQANSDGDSFGNACDNCPTVTNADQANSDADSLGNACDGCPTDANKTAPGSCGCGIADLDANGNGTVDCLEGDSDGDGTPDASDRCPNDPTKTVPGTCGCGRPDVDADGDGILDCQAIVNLAQLGLLPSIGVLSGDDFGTAVAAA